MKGGGFPSFPDLLGSTSEQEEWTCLDYRDAPVSGGASWGE